MNRPYQSAEQLVLDLADVIREVSNVAAKSAPQHLVFVLDRDNPTALELLTEYAPITVQLARDGVDDVDVIAMRLADGLNLLRAPNHAPTIFRTVADQIEAERTDDTIGLCVAGGGFVRFRVGPGEAVN